MSQEAKARTVKMDREVSFESVEDCSNQSPVASTSIGPGLGGGANSVLLVAPVPIRPQMSGPGIRYWEFARALSRQQRVTLLTPNESSLAHDRFTVQSCTDADAFHQALNDHSVVVLQGFTLFLKSEIVPILAASDNFIAVDLYTPVDLEGLELRPETSPDAVDWNLVDVNVLREQAKIGDFFFCASERQRDYWLGMLSALGRINPHVYWDDRTGRRLIDVVPFGLSDVPPVAKDPALKGVHPKLAPSDKVLLWFGGLWNWLDPLTVIHAFARLVREQPDARLAFVTRMGENLSDPASAMAFQAVALSKELGLYEDQILFCQTIPFDERGSLLLEADVGLCYHPAHLEARFSYRTRLLDYIWAGLPIITGSGDVLGELVAAEGLGYAVRAGDVEGVYSAMVALLNDPDARRSRQEAFARVRGRLTWQTAIGPLADFCRNPYHAADRDIETYAPYRSSDWERLIYDNVQDRHQLAWLRRRLEEQDAIIEDKEALIQEQSATIQDKDKVIYEFRSGRVMRLILGVQEHLRKLVWFGKG